MSFFSAIRFHDDDAQVLLAAQRDGLLFVRCACARARACRLIGADVHAALFIALTATSAPDRRQTLSCARAAHTTTPSSHWRRLLPCLFGSRMFFATQHRLRNELLQHASTTPPPCFSLKALFWCAGRRPAPQGLKLLMA